MRSAAFIVVSGFSGWMTFLGETSAAGALTTMAGGRLAFDSNVFLQEQVPLAAGQTQVMAPAEEDAWITQASAGVTAVWTRSERLRAEGTYSVDRFVFHPHSEESHTDHRLVASIRVEGEGWSGEAKAQGWVVDGSEEAPVYNCLGGAPAIGGEPVRSRRAQSVAKSSGRLRHDPSPEVFVRGTYGIQVQDFQTLHRSSPYGYVNYTDRRELGVGAEMGRTVWADWYAVGAFRLGEQRQADVLGVPLNYSNTFRRVLVGLETRGKGPIRLAVLAGPDYRHYGASVRPGFERRQREAFWELDAGWTIGPRVSLAATSKRYAWLGSGGRAGLLEDVHELQARWSPLKSLTLSPSFRWHEGDTRQYASAPRHDRIYTVAMQSSYTPNRHVRWEAGVIHDWSVSCVPATPAREYSRWQVFSGLAGQW